MSEANVSLSALIRLAPKSGKPKEKLTQAYERRLSEGYTKAQIQQAWIERLNTYKATHEPGDFRYLPTLLSWLTKPNGLVAQQRPEGEADKRQIEQKIAHLERVKKIDCQDKKGDWENRIRAANEEIAALRMRL